MHGGKQICNSGTFVIARNNDGQGITHTNATSFSLSFAKTEAKYSIVLLRPVFRSTAGCHCNSWFALVISGQRCLGSSIGKGQYLMVDLLFVNLIIISAISFIVFSMGFPKLTGACNWGLFIKAINPEIR